MSTDRTLRLASFLLAMGTGSLVFACSSSSEIDTTATDAGAPDTGSDAKVADSGNDASDAASDAPVVCSYPPYANPIGCPAQYAFSYQGKPCAPIGLRCAYPGSGDGMANGCFSTAMMWCYGDGGIGSVVDAGDGGDAGSGTWTVAQ